MSYSLYPLAVVMERRVLANRWQSEQWEAVEVHPAHCVGPTLCVPVEAGENRSRWLWSGFALDLNRTEAENYYLNLSAAEPKVFVMWRLENELAEPRLVTSSSGTSTGLFSTFA